MATSIKTYLRSQYDTLGNYWRNYFTERANLANIDGMPQEQQTVDEQNAAIDKTISSYIRSALQEVGQTYFGRDLSPDEIDKLASFNVEDPSAIISDRGLENLDSWYSLLTEIKGTQSGQNMLKGMIKAGVDGINPDDVVVLDPSQWRSEITGQKSAYEASQKTTGTTSGAPTVPSTTQAFEQRVSDALSAFANKIPTREAEIRGILSEQMGRLTPELERGLSEERVAGGLGKGYFEQSLSEELAKRQGDIESQVSTWGLGQRSMLDQYGLNLQQQLAEMQRQDELLGYSNDVNYYLNRLGFEQQMAAMQQQNKYAMQQMGSSQNFQAYQSMLDRNMQREMFAAQLKAQNDAEKRARKQATTGAMWQLGGTALGAIGGFALGGPPGAMIGAGVLGGNQGLTTAGFLY